MVGLIGGSGRKTDRPRKQAVRRFKVVSNSVSSNSILREIRSAYSDTAAQKGNSWGERVLHFLSSEPVPAALLYNHVKYIGPYNDFYPKRACDRLVKADPRAMVFVGREYSPVLYIRPSSGSAGDRLYKAFKGHADEVGFVSEAPSSSRGSEEYKPGTLLRVWWD